MLKNKRQTVLLAALLSSLAILPSRGVFAATSRTYTAAISPASVIAQSAQSFSISVQNTSAKGKIRSATIAVPSGFLVDPQTLSLSGSAPSNWSARYSGGNIYIAKTSSGKNSGVAPGSSFSVSFSSIAPSNPGDYVFTVSAYKEKFDSDRTDDDNEGDDADFVIVGSEPVVTVLNATPVEVFSSGPRTKSPNGAQDISITTTADDFTLSSTTTLRSAKFYSIENPPAAFAGMITWYIFKDNAGKPGDIIYSSSTVNVTRVDLGPIPSGIPGFNYEEFENSFDLPNTVLGPGKYWLGLHNGPDQAITTFSSMYWEATAPNASSYDNYAYLPPFGGGIPNWVVDTGGQLSFSLYK